jgi:hypothetical protein
MRKIDYWLLTHTGFLNELLWRLTGRSLAYQITAKRWTLSKRSPLNPKRR